MGTFLILFSKLQTIAFPLKSLRVPDPNIVLTGHMESSLSQ